MSPNAPTDVSSISPIEEVQGKLGFKDVDEGLLHSVVENDKETIDEGRMISDSLNNGISAFTPDVLFERLVTDYHHAEELYGEKLLQYITGYPGDYLTRNIKIPEFQREIKKRIGENTSKLKEKGIYDENGWTKKGIELAAVLLYIDELDHLVPKGQWGEYAQKKKTPSGSPREQEKWKKGTPYRDIAIKRTIHRAIRRGHTTIQSDDLQAHARENKGRTVILYTFDASGSMKGKKIEAAKKAGVALAGAAVQKKDKIGLVVFKEKVEVAIPPTDSLGQVIEELVKIKPGKETDFVQAVRTAVTLFPKGKETKHIIFLTDALPTIGKDPEAETLQAVADATNHGITISVIGISLEKEGLALAQKIVDLGKGKLYTTKKLEELDKIILEDYYAVESSK